jgi:cystathionine beta-synthase
LDNPSLKEAEVQTIMADPFPFVLPSTKITLLSKMITKENPAVIVQNEDGSHEIITKSDLLDVLVQ